MKARDLFSEEMVDDAVAELTAAGISEEDIESFALDGVFNLVLEPND